MDTSTSASSQQGSKPPRKRGHSPKVWQITLAVQSLGNKAERKCYMIKEAAGDSAACPRTKPERMGSDEEQNTRRQPGWWFLVTQRGFRALRVQTSVKQFPRTGKQELHFSLTYGSTEVYALQAQFDFTARALPDSAKIHVDKNHDVKRRTFGHEHFESSANDTDYLFLRLQGRTLTAVRFFLPLEVMERVQALYRTGWLKERWQDMYDTVGLPCPPFPLREETEQSQESPYFDDENNGDSQHQLQQHRHKQPQEQTQNKSNSTQALKRSSRAKNSPSKRKQSSKQQKKQSAAPFIETVAAPPRYSHKQEEEEEEEDEENGDSDFWLFVDDPLIHPRKDKEKEIPTTTTTTAQIKTYSTGSPPTTRKRLRKFGSSEKLSLRRSSSSSSSLTSSQQRRQEEDRESTDVGLFIDLVAEEEGAEEVRTSSSLTMTTMKEMEIVKTEDSGYVQQEQNTVLKSISTTTAIAQVQEKGGNEMELAQDSENHSYSQESTNGLMNDIVAGATKLVRLLYRSGGSQQELSPPSPSSSTSLHQQQQPQAPTLLTVAAGEMITKCPSPSLLSSPSLLPPPSSSTITTALNGGAFLFEPSPTRISHHPTSSASISASSSSKTKPSFSVFENNTTTNRLQHSQEKREDDGNDSFTLIAPTLASSSVTATSTGNVAYAMSLQRILSKGSSSSSTSTTTSTSIAVAIQLDELDEKALEFAGSDPVGSGSFARVFKARWRGEDVAVKVFNANETDLRIENELQILATLRGHPHIVQVIGYCCSNDGRKQIAMEYCAFGNLYNLIHATKNQHRMQGRNQQRGGREGTNGFLRRTRRTHRPPAKFAVGESSPVKRRGAAGEGEEEDDEEYEIKGGRRERGKGTKRTRRASVAQVDSTLETKRNRGGNERNQQKRTRSLGGGALRSLRREENEEEEKEDDPFYEFKQRRNSLLLGIARGMEYIHSKNICHRDLSSMNILVDGNWVPKIADFGLSKMGETEMTGMGVGTGRWRAPEVFRKKPKRSRQQFEGHYTNSSDVYSFAIIAWELFHLGDMPWEGELDEEVARKVLQGDRPPIRKDSCPPEWQELIEQCWQHDPKERPAFSSIVQYSAKYG
ncbi:Serine/threonine-protein kinase HT1 [Balamuthia mandrillaris]